MTQINSIPTIDLSTLWDDNSGIKYVALQLKEKFASIGFAYLINHGIPQELIDAIFQESKRFHALPLEIKLKVKQNQQLRGYFPNNTHQSRVSTEGSAAKPNQVESFLIGFEVEETHPDYKDGLYLAAQNQWPENLPGFKNTLYQYREAMLNLSHRLVTAFVLALGITPYELEKLFIDPAYLLRLLHYPAQEINVAPDQFGLAPHTDASFMTILAQDSLGGLEAKLDDGQWVHVPYKPNTLVLNSGIILQQLTNDIFRAIPHRVINRSSKQRYSIPFFFNTNMHSMIEPLDCCITKENPAQYAPIMYGDYLLNRTQTNYGVGKR